MRVICVLLCLLSTSVFAQRVNQETMEYIVKHNFLERESIVASNSSTTSMREQLPAGVELSEIEVLDYDMDIDMGGNLARFINVGLSEDHIDRYLRNFDGNREFNEDLNELYVKLKVRGIEYRYSCKKVRTVEDFLLDGTSKYSVDLRKCKIKNLENGVSVNLSDESLRRYSFDARSNISETSRLPAQVMNGDRLALKQQQQLQQLYHQSASDRAMND